MRKLLLIARWLFLICFLAWGLVCLNSAAFSAWVSGGPPTDYPRAWAQRALVHLGYGISSIATGCFLFVALRPGYNFRKSTMKWLWLILVGVSLGYPKVREFMLIDKCLDAGGRWDKTHFECTK